MAPLLISSLMRADDIKFFCNCDLFLVLGKLHSATNPFLMTLPPSSPVISNFIFGKTNHQGTDCYKSINLTGCGETFNTVGTGLRGSKEAAVKLYILSHPPT